MKRRIGSILVLMLALGSVACGGKGKTDAKYPGGVGKVDQLSLIHISEPTRPY